MFCPMPSQILTIRKVKPAVCILRSMQLVVRIPGKESGGQSSLYPRFRSDKRVDVDRQVTTGKASHSTRKDSRIPIIVCLPTCM